MNDITKQFSGSWRLRRGLVLVLTACLLGCGGGPTPAAQQLPDVLFRVTPDAALGSVAVTACADGPMAFRPWAAPWSRLTVTEGSRVADTLRSSERGCVGYAVQLVANRHTQFADGVVVSAHSEWLLRPVGPVGQVRVRFHLAAGARAVAPWPHVGAGGENSGEEETFALPPLALELPSDVLIGRFELSRRAVGATELAVARVPGTLAHSQEELVAHIARAVEIVTSVGGAFPSERVLAIVWPAPSDQPVQFGLTKRGGGASILLFFGEQAAAGSLNDDWVTVHELAHLLHPLVHGADRWLTEGIATYYQEVLRARGGWKTPELAWARIIEGFEAGRRGGTGRSLRDEAMAMHETAAYTRVYWGGAAFVLAADMRLRARGSSLDEAIARCLREVERSARPVSARDLVGVFDPELVALADEYAARSEWAPTDALLGELGLVYEAGAVRFVDAPRSDLRDAIMRADVRTRE